MILRLVYSRNRQGTGIRQRRDDRGAPAHSSQDPACAVDGQPGGPLPSGSLCGRSDVEIGLKAIVMLVRSAVGFRRQYRFSCCSRGRLQSYATDAKGALPRWRDRTLAMFEEPALGAHLITPRIGYVHHGIYSGHGNVMHCGAVSCFLPRGAVEEVSLQDFCRGRPVAVREGVPEKFDAREIVERARSRLGENRYRLLTNNCEHFCEWCLRGEQRSYQVERLMRWMPRPRVSSAVSRGRLAYYEASIASRDPCASIRIAP